MNQPGIRMMNPHTYETASVHVGITDEDKFAACVHCGMCLESCPTYDELGHEHQSPRGRVHLMKAVAQGKMAISEAFADPVFTCLDCRACETACPSGVQVGTLIEEARGQIREDLPLTGWKKTVSRTFLRNLFPYPTRLHAIGKVLKVYQRSGLQSFVRKTGLVNLAPQHLRDMEAIMPTVTEPTLTKYPYGIPASGEAKMRVALFTGCIMDVMFSDINEATIRVLTRNGYEVGMPQGQRCCGALHVHAGDREEGRRLARQNIDAFLSADPDKIIVNAAGCGCALKEYPELLRDDREYRERAEQFAAKVEDVSKFLHDYGYRKPQGKLDTRITYHDACHLAHGQGVRQEPRELLENIPGLQMIPLPDADRCCGSAGIYNLTNPDMAGRILDKKMENVPADVELISMGNPGCMLQIAMGVAKYGRSQRVVHTVQLLDWSYQKEGRDVPMEEV
ncbi:glycolate oxidase [Aneurinibacillus migulanus]|uniref:Glycolate oxidase iron-sulfur subunit n=2 Tax=Aneurinibacillus migulanus TaxID=47500 RepID=A0A1G8IPJ7_ANEMI|nr:glycolate oxidase [Aneurinibacillus migulanus]GED12501.1 glycolate oxidase iron-sulfur subunit [Aneurinibacillus migulanus]SDI20440.1 glycolate oxidase iron-sulfur subunit [Aneurinibacillus migulanus]